MIKHSATPRKKVTFDELVENDTLGLFDGVTGTNKKTASSSNSLIDNFEKINVFFERNQREPEDCNDLEESKLARALAHVRAKDTLKAQVIELDRYALLGEADLATQQAEVTNEIQREPAQPKKPLNTLDDVFDSGLLDDDSTDIFNLKHVTTIKAKPEKIAERKTCTDFDKYESFFEDLDQMVKAREVEIKRFSNVGQIKKGDIFISGGLYCFVAEVGEYRENNDGRYDPRLRVIYSNGTESNLLLWSLAKSLYADPNGKQIIRGVESIYEQFGAEQVPEGSIKTGEIYFLRSLSERPEIKAIPNLIKIGVTSGSTYKRIENAAKEKTYLEAPVEILKILPCYNLNAGNLEKLIHHKLHDTRKNITISSPGGGVYKATEWFDVRLDTAIQAVEEIMNNLKNSNNSLI